VAGLRDGATLEDRFNGNEFTPRGASRPITNAGGTNYGPVTLEKATTNSINSAYVDLVMQMRDGPAKVAQAAKDVGITTPIPDSSLVPSIPLGFSEVSALDAARGLATLVNEGKRSNPHIVAEVKDVKGQTIYKPTLAEDQTVEADVARNAVHALTGVTQEGTGRAVSGLGHEVAGKTGTYYDSEAEQTKATWFIGSTKQISTAFVLTAGDQGTSDLGRNTYGSTYAARGWLEYMRVAMDDLDRVNFPGPTRQSSSGKFTAPPVPKPTARPTETATPEPTAAPSEAPSEDPGQQQPGEPGAGQTEAPGAQPGATAPAPAQSAPPGSNGNADAAPGAAPPGRG
ncbi:MAG: penicillin-binding transpeptidase domain-containing protein, partial [Actinomycetes bacterium]